MFRAGGDDTHLGTGDAAGDLEAEAVLAEAGRCY